MYDIRKKIRVLIRLRTGHGSIPDPLVNPPRNLGDNRRSFLLASGKIADKDGQAVIAAVAARFPSRFAIHLIMITSNGLTRNAYSGIAQNEVVADDLF